MSNISLNADDELRKDIEHIILAWSSETTGEPRERLAPDALTLVDRFSNFILADRKKHELQAYSDGFQKASKGAFKSQQAAKREAVEAVLDRVQNKQRAWIEDNPGSKVANAMPILSAIEAERNKLEAEL